MKRTKLKELTRFSLRLMACLLAAVLTTGAAKAQQEVDPDHFDQRPAPAKLQTTGPHAKNKKSAQKRRPRKAVTRTAKSDPPRGDKSKQDSRQTSR